jgi:ketosteroid isomerase-like protein
VVRGPVETGEQWAGLVGSVAEVVLNAGRRRSTRRARKNSGGDDREDGTHLRSASHRRGTVIRLTDLDINRRLVDAFNAHDLDALVACFHEDYRSEQPAHPARGFTGREQVRTNWGQVFAGVPDLSAELLREAQTGDTAWGEWRFQGGRADGTRLDMAGVILCGVRDGRIAWARLYLELVEPGDDIETAVRGMSEGR